MQIHEEHVFKKKKNTHRADIQIVQAGHLQPLTEEVLLHAGLCLEDGQRDGSEGETQMGQCQTLLLILQSACAPQTFNIRVSNSDNILFDHVL